MRIHFLESCIPPRASHHAKKIVRVGGFSRMADKPDLVAAKSFWDALFLPHRPEKPLTGPLYLKIVLCWPWNKSDSKRVRAVGFVRHDTNPDLSNMAKTIEDALGRCGYFANDSQVVSLHLEKWRGDNPRIEVTLEETT